MRRRQSGAYARVYESIDDHPKTRAAVEVLVAAVPSLSADLAGAIVVRAVRRLVCWAIRASDTGRTGHLSDAALVTIAWPGALSPGGALWGAQDVGLLRRALRAVPQGYDHGFLWTFGRGQGRPGCEYIHEFQAHAWHALKDRPHYQGASLADFDGNPMGVVRPGLTPAQADEVAPGPAAAPPGSPAVLGAQAPPPAAVAPAGADGRRAGGWAEVQARLRARLGAPGAPKPLQGNDPARKVSEGGGFASLSLSSPPGSDGPMKSNPGGPGWSDVPGGVFAGEPPAVAVWLRAFGAFSKAGLYDGFAYLKRWTEASGLQPPEGMEGPEVTPGRALELLEPRVFEGLVADLSTHLPKATYPRTYTARALAARWSDVLGKMEDAAQERRSRFRSGTG